MINTENVLQYLAAPSSDEGSDLMEKLKKFEGQLIEITGPITAQELFEISKSIPVEIGIIKLKNGSRFLVVGNEDSVPITNNGMSSIPIDQVAIFIHTHPKKEGIIKRGPSGSDYAFVGATRMSNVRSILVAEETITEFLWSDTQKDPKDALLSFTKGYSQVHFQKKFDLFDNNLSRQEAAEIDEVFSKESQGKYTRTLSANELEELIN